MLRVREANERPVQQLESPPPPNIATAPTPQAPMTQPIPPASTARYAILSHDFPYPHWDLFLEVGPVLSSWRLAERPDRCDSVPAERAPDHRLEYLEYEGPISNERGSVVRWDRGHYTTRSRSSDRWLLRFEGEQMRGVWCLSRLPDSELWQLARQL